MPRLMVLVLLAPLAHAEEGMSAFYFKKEPGNVKAAIDLNEVRQGVRSRGPDPRDVIPAIRKPRAIPADKATWLRGGDRVLGIVVNGEARAYPLKILESHEMVNDFIGGVPVGPNY